MENLIPVINKLQDAFASAGLSGFDLPQIAVVGSQSSGKSSVLENIVGKDFLPRGSGIVTRRPLVLQLNHHSSDEEYGIFLHKPDQKISDFHQIRMEIQKETDRTTGSNKGISSSPINLKIFSPNVINLTLIDLPGITKVPVGDQPPDIELQIRNMIMQFIEKESCLILAVSPANADIANSDALQLALKVDPEGERTIGVITKLDLMDEGTDALDVLTNKTFPLKHGFVGVVNRSQKDIDMNKDVSSALKKEKDWFSNHSVYREICSHCGTQFLREKLRKTLIHHIHHHLPALRGRLQQRAAALEKELAIINAPFKDLDPFSDNFADGNFTTDPSKLQSALLNIIRMFGSTVKSLIDGHDGDVSFNGFDVLGFMTGAPTSNAAIRKNWATVELNSSVRIKHLFKDVFPRTLAHIERRILSSCMDEEIRTIIMNVCGLRAGLFVPDAVFEILVKKEILRLEIPALECVDAVHDELIRMINMILHGENCAIRFFPRLQSWMMSETHIILEQCKKPTIEEVKRLIAMEVSYINTSHPDFAGKDGIANFMVRERENRKNNQHRNNIFAKNNKNQLKVVNKEGYLTKLGGTRKSWKKRWFVLRNGLMTFYESPSDKDPKGSFPLNSCFIRDLDSGSVYPSNENIQLPLLTSEDADTKGKDNVFQICSIDGSFMFRNHQQLYLFADNDSEKDEWIQAICDSIIWSDLEKNKGNNINQSKLDSPTSPVSIKSPPPPPPSRGGNLSISTKNHFRNPTKASNNENEGILPRLPDQLYSTDIRNDNYLFNSSYSPISETADASSSLNSTDEASISLVRLLLHSYFVIVRKHVQDLVPKAIMLLMISKLKKDLPSVLGQKILTEYKDSKLNAGALLQENELVREERIAKTQMLELVKKALNAVDVDFRSAA